MNPLVDESIRNHPVEVESINVNPVMNESINSYPVEVKSTYNIPINMEYINNPNIGFINWNQSKRTTSLINDPKKRRKD